MALGSSAIEISVPEVAGVLELVGGVSEEVAVAVVSAAGEHATVANRPQTSVILWMARADAMPATY
jgi:hypothetical protein